MSRILIVDDERTTRMALCQAFNQEPMYEAQMAASGAEALQLLAQQKFDVVLLDLQMPGITGDMVLLQAEEVAPESAFIVLTAHASTETAITAVKSGAFDYLRKPSSLTTIFTVVKKALLKQEKRQQQERAIALLQQATKLFEDKMKAPVAVAAPFMFIIDEPKQAIAYEQEWLDLTPIEYRLLAALLQNPDTVVNYASLAAYTHNMTLAEFEAKTLLRTHVHRLRLKLRREHQDPLQTIRGRGVLLSGTVAYR